MKIYNTEKAPVLTELILEIFHLNGALVNAGDRLTQDFSLTSARWKIMGGIALSSAPPTVAQISRRIGLTRQGVLRIANDLLKLGIIEYLPNPDHKKANLIELTIKGKKIYEKLMQRQNQWISKISNMFAAESIAEAKTFIQKFTKILEQENTK
jgi:DNA-binding MarR family transcriptional regulator